jgi:hypothetical protein
MVQKGKDITDSRILGGWGVNVSSHSRSMGTMEIIQHGGVVFRFETATNPKPLRPPRRRRDIEA